MESPLTKASQGGGKRTRRRSRAGARHDQGDPAILQVQPYQRNLPQICPKNGAGKPDATRRQCPGAPRGFTRGACYRQEA